VQTPEIIGHTRVVYKTESSVTATEKVWVWDDPKRDDPVTELYISPIAPISQLTNFCQFLTL